MSRSPLPLTERALAAARVRRSHGESWKVIATSLGVSQEGLRRHLDPEYRRLRNLQAAQNKRARNNNSSAVQQRLEPPHAVLIERNARQSAPRSLSALIFGDPPVGYSALDRRQ